MNYSNLPSLIKWCAKDKFREYSRALPSSRSLYLFPILLFLTLHSFFFFYNFEPFVESLIKGMHFIYFFVGIRAAYLKQEGSLVSYSPRKHPISPFWAVIIIAFTHVLFLLIFFTIPVLVPFMQYISFQSALLILATLSSMFILGFSVALCFKMYLQGETEPLLIVLLYISVLTLFLVSLNHPPIHLITPYAFYMEANFVSLLALISSLGVPLLSASWFTPIRDEQGKGYIENRYTTLRSYSLVGRPISLKTTLSVYRRGGFLKSLLGISIIYATFLSVFLTLPFNNGNINSALFAGSVLSLFIIVPYIWFFKSGYEEYEFLPTNRERYIISKTQSIISFYIPTVFTLYSISVYIVGVEPIMYIAGFVILLVQSLYNLTVILSFRVASYSEVMNYYISLILLIVPQLYIALFALFKLQVGLLPIILAYIASILVFCAILLKYNILSNI